MCGIGILIAPVSAAQQGQHSTHSDDAPSPLQRCWPSVLQNIANRGPDCLNTVQHHFRINDSSSAAASWTLSFTSSVLSLRGDGVTQQPLCSIDGRLLLAWNGQIFDWDAPEDESDADRNRATSSRVRLDSGENDAIVLLDSIQRLLETQHRDGSQVCSVQHALNTALSQVEGPYAFVLLDCLESKLYFGRDPLGRRSLLLHRSPQYSTLSIVSVAAAPLMSAAEEVGASLTEIDCSSLWTIDLLHSPTSPQSLPRLLSRFTSPLLLRELRSPELESIGDTSPEQVRNDFLSVLSESVRRRVTNINTDQPAHEAHVAILFSGGLDCTTLALLADRHVPKEQPIDLLNVGFENVRAIQAAKHEREKRLRSKLKAASKRTRAQQEQLQGQHNCEILQDATDASRDSGAEAEDASEAYSDDVYAVPDRLTGLSSYAELCQLSPTRRWNLVCINVAYSEYTLHRATVSELMAPSCSVMDLSIASALYFASCGRGHVDPNATPYTSPARVLISGLGADELLGGYSRHRQAYHHHSLDGLTAELQLDLDRLPSRNLGRDDRILSAHSKEARYPFLDRRVLDFLTATPVHRKVQLSTIASEGKAGDKRLLRDLACQLGLLRAAELKKRAMQFGTRSAKIDAESKHVKGHHKLT